MLNIIGKTKDIENAHEDLRDMKIRKELWIQQGNKKLKKPPTCYILSRSERKAFLEFLNSIKFSIGFASNISICIKDDKLIGLKTHDCHILLQRLLPAGVRGYLRKEVSQALFKLGDFFKKLCSKTLKIEDIEKLERNISVILYKLE